MCAFGMTSKRSSSTAAAAQSPEYRDRSLDPIRSWRSRMRTGHTVLVWYEVSKSRFKASHGRGRTYSPEYMSVPVHPVLPPSTMSIRPW